MKIQIINDIIAAIEARDKKTKPYDTTATVVREEGSTLWVHIPGGVDETPVRKSINANIGDTVNVRISGGSAWITGNYSAPPTDDTTANVAKHTAENAQRTAKTAKTTAETASRIAGNTTQHFWMTEEGSDTGAHISEVTQEEFLADPENGGGNLLARSNGIAIRDGLEELATFGADELRMGKIEKTHLSIDFHSLKLVDVAGVFFYVSDLRDADGNLTDTFVGNGTRVAFELREIPSSLLYAKVDGTEMSVTFSGKVVTFSTAPGSGSAVEIVYTPINSYYTRAYTFGIRGDDTKIGLMSVAEGSGCYAEGRCAHAEGDTTFANGVNAHAEGALSRALGYCSHAEGSGTRAEGDASHAQNSNTVAGYSNQTAIGKYNDNQSNSALEIGNGSDAHSRSNALTVDWSGNVDVAGDITDGSGNQLSKKLDNTFATATGTVNSNITVSRAKCQLLKIGNVVFITIAMGNITSSVNTNTNLFTIPAAYRPSSNVSLQGTINDSVGNFTVRSDGYVRQTLVSALTNCFCAGFYTI